MQIKNNNIPFHLSQIAHQENKQQQMLVKMWGNRNPHTMWVGM
jgi:hypothetical protein